MALMIQVQTPLPDINMVVLLPILKIIRISTLYITIEISLTRLEPGAIIIKMPGELTKNIFGLNHMALTLKEAILVVELEVIQCI